MEILPKPSPKRHLNHPEIPFRLRSILSVGNFSPALRMHAANADTGKQRRDRVCSGERGESQWRERREPVEREESVTSRPGSVL
jgi:hypothetical protein